jgi:hypothetical protein
MVAVIPTIATIWLCDGPHILFSDEQPFGGLPTP